MKPVFFIDVDGTIIPTNPVNADNHVCVHRTIVVPARTRVVNGFSFTEEQKTFTVEEEVAWRSSLLVFLKQLESEAEIVWLTSWKHNVKVLEEILGLGSHEWLEWDLSDDESGKITALNKFMEQRSGVPFIWADDFATIVNADKLHTLPENGLILDVEPELGISDEQINQIKDFLNG